ncbi:segregation and condensation protein A [Mesomycoplasma conjunctivae]|uniref:Segregation and condensation protein A n=1 Tax=Mesomycoplasma conjunctivae (strain ATCC 25834 / NCTC 10147 / HRC/581) TaxID=572263 RepID=C5J5S5_MESCH|nr:segregation/condensation protein A [Mesomycoplasma conjunctivae]CAT04813.1 Segregation and condensation protein A [Mesomycoplasma conjunctivae]VEU65845.1 segregation and condensation protein A [Mesomycoplasma conjunctivae]
MLEKDIEFKFQNFSGPLELLLDLVRSKNVDIMDVDLVDLANQYVAIIEHVKNKNIHIASEYLVMAATLIHIKAKMLLQVDNKEVDVELEEDKAQILALLSEYQQIKNIALMLKEQLEHRNNYFEKNVSDYQEFKRPLVQDKLDGHSSLVKLLEIIKLMFDRTRAQKKIMIKTDEVFVSPDQQNLYVMELLKNNEQLEFDQVFALPSLKHFSITLIAVLEMAKKRILYLEQARQFADIKIYRGTQDEE